MTYRTLRAVLFHPGSTLHSALRDPGKGTELQLDPGLKFTARAFLVEARLSQPSWLAYLEDGAQNVPGLMNQANGSVILVEVADQGISRVVAFTFGNGRTLLSLEAIEHDFGLRVVVNSVNPDRLRRVETKVFDDMVLHRSTQASRHSPTVTFAIDDVRDLLRAVGGEPRDRTFARRIEGSDSLSISSDVEFKDLGALAVDLLRRYASDDYKVDFGFVEHVQPVRDAGTVARLNDEMEAALTTGRLDDLRVYLAPPEIIDFEKVDGFRYPHERQGRDDPHPDLDLSEFLLAIGRGEATIANLKRFRIRAVDGVGAEFDVWPAYNCLIYETREGPDQYMLSEGQWFKVRDDFAASVDADVAAIDRIDLGWPDANAGEPEAAYNVRISAADPALGHFDAHPIKLPGQRTTIEACDVLAERNLIHVKRRTSSATLSHLFAQGRISAESFRWEPDVREQMRAHVGNGHPLFGSIPVDEPSPREFAVTFAILAKNAAELPAQLPFFSKLNLARTARDVRRLGYRVQFSAIRQA